MVELFETEGGGARSIETSTRIVDKDYCDPIVCCAYGYPTADSQTRKQYIDAQQ